MENASSSSSGTAGQQDTSDLIKEQVSQGAQTAADKTQQVAGQVAQTAKGKAQSAFQTQKQQMTQNLTTVTQALRDTSNTLESKNVGPAATVLDSAADRIEGATTYLQSSNLDDIMRDAENFARQNPFVFLGGAFALGVAAARFLKSSAASSSSSNGQYGGGYTQGYGGYGRSNSTANYGSSDTNSGYGTYAPVNDLTTGGMNDAYVAESFTATEVDTPDIAFEDGVDTGAINGTASEPR
jgi:uncharacterized protein YukE